ncbi:fumarylacetoacetate hydrolase family protein [Alicyclobacillus fastidiosus]|uniref:Fumarylacetoacetate hydrolase family protein n=1 Tax=Alicyclobacillus fastidiosus TaxID=392011 RepID=A0ABY6ZDA4_9BACL|nr:fumarylacetoacetate hydrolase family protein [Alicyclobacillus fastidiosus]WAH40533.1 fumarylacetoacetate hydrolase family protein [Alicyclobacillus fastidiosus]GMA61963.1 2-hydroxyhepta-2,4-diene-1,7-dioate isomerase [Alicyclobacillus fastidiosus]
MSLLKTIRYTHPDLGTPQLGLLDGDRVYSLTEQVPTWTCPVLMWRALQALDIRPSAVVQRLQKGTPLSFAELASQRLLLPPVATPEVWASGVTYERSREARNAETQIKDSVYDRVYTAARPELFFKATYERLVAPLQPISLRSDSNWMVPEPELAIVVSANGDLIGYTVGDDVSSRDIEGENPLYLPQAKVFSGSCSLGPALLWSDGEEKPETWTIELTIYREDAVAFSGQVPFSQFRRSFSELTSYLLRDNTIADGTVLMTGTGIVPPDEFTLLPGDVVEIAIEPIGVLKNAVISPLLGKVLATR